MDINKQSRLDEINEEIHRLFEKNISEATPKDLPKLIEALSKVDSPTERAIYIKQLAKKFGISAGIIDKDVKNSIRSSNKKEVTVRANFSELIDIAIDSDGEVVFLIGGLDLTAEKEFEIDGKIYVPPKKEDIPFMLPRSDYVITYYRRYYEDVETDEKLYGDIVDYFKRFSFLKEKDLQIISLYVFLTYIQDHKDIFYLPVILFYAVPERGKTRTGKAFTYLAYRGIHQVDLREANLFRYSENFQASLFLDIKDLWKKAERSGSEDILLLRYEKGATVSRVLYPERGPFEDMKHFHIYGPTVISTNEAIHKILDSRCIPINMENRPALYEDPSPEKAQELKERLTAWRARTISESLPNVEHIQELNGRLWDISKPLLQVCKLVNPGGLTELKEALIRVANQRIEDKKESIEGQIVQAIYELSPSADEISEWNLKTQEILELLNKTRPDRYELTPQYLGRKLKAMGLKTRKIRGHSDIKLDRAGFELLCLQYGIIEKNGLHPPEKTLPNATTLPKQGLSTVCGGRELVESGRESNKTLPPQSLENQGFESLVELGRVSAGGTEEILIEGEVQ